MITRGTPVKPHTQNRNQRAHKIRLSTSAIEIQRVQLNVWHPNRQNSKNVNGSLYSGGGVRLQWKQHIVSDLKMLHHNEGSPTIMQTTHKGHNEHKMHFSSHDNFYSHNNHNPGYYILFVNLWTTHTKYR